MNDVKPIAPATNGSSEGNWPRTAPGVSLYAERIQPYVPTSSLEQIAAGDSRNEPFKLDWNESTIAPSPNVVEAILAFMRGSHNLNWYPDLECTRLRAALADYVGLTPEHFLVTNGSDDALALVCNTYLNPRDQVVVPMPTYTHFLVFAGSRGAHVQSVYGETPFRRNLDGIIGSVNFSTKLIYLVSPNNPTGIVYGPDEVRQICEAAPYAIVVVDEAYFEFCGKTVAHLVDEFPNLVVTRTFSKSFGIAGLRVGYAIARPDVIEDLRRLHNPKSVNAMGQVAAEAALRDLPYLNEYVESVTDAKQMLVRFFYERGVFCRSTPANYILVRVPDTHRFCELLAGQGVFVRDRSNIPQMRGFVRMSVGTVDQTREVMKRLDRVLTAPPCAVV